TSVKTESIGGLLSVVNGKNDGSLNQDLNIEGLVSATDNQIKFDNLKVSTEDFTGNGKFSVQNLKAKNPLLIKGNIQSANALNLNPFLQKSSSEKILDKASSAGGSSKSSSEKDIVLSSLTLPMAVDADVKIDVAGLRFQKYKLRGVALDLSKADKEIKASFNIKEMPGQAKASGALSINYASSSQSPKTGEVTYSDPAIQYNVDGNIGQLSSFFSEFAPDIDAKAITENYNSAQFNLDGTFNGGAVELKESVVKLDDTIISLGGSYKPATSSSRSLAAIEVRADTIDFDSFSNDSGGKKASSSADGNATAAKSSSKDKSDALKPLQNLSLPLDLDFDVSIQKARIGGRDLNGLLADGKIMQNKLTIDNVSVNDYAGAVLSLKGAVGNLKELSGLDLTAYIKTDDLKSFANTMDIDASKIPASVNKLEVTVEGKGNINDVSFALNIKALGGFLDASGRAKNALKTTELSGLILRVVHPNANNAVKAIVLGFEGSDALEQSVDFYTKVNSSGKIYDLSDIKAKLGTSDFTGNLKIDTSNKVTGVSGNISAGKLALDSLLGAKTAKSGSSSGGGSSGGGSSSSSSKGKWSDNPIDLSWMNSNNINVVLSAENLTYGKWAFSNPSTELKIANGSMRVRDLKAGVFGGTAKLDTTVNANPVSIDLSSTMNGIDLEKLVSALSNSNRLKARGDVSFSINVKGAGNSSRALVSSLNGKSNVDGTNIVLEGFDLAKITQALSRDEKFINSLQGFASGALDGGETQFDTLDGDYDITNGIVKISKMVLDGPVAVINSDGQADLPKWYVAVNNYISLKNVEDFEPINIELKGPISNPKTFGKNILQDYLDDKIKRKLGKELPDLLGDDVSGALQQFGIIPKQEAPKENSDLNDVIEQEANDNAPAPQPVKEEPKKPEDALKDILGGGNAEDAVNDLIKGLF
ncbi:MAG: AsmA-like C-terminal region-containing protein, partial [Pseudomonadota bacterium]